MKLEALNAQKQICGAAKWEITSANFHDHLIIRTSSTLTISQISYVFHLLPDKDLSEGSLSKIPLPADGFEGLIDPIVVRCKNSTCELKNLA